MNRRCGAKKERRERGEGGAGIESGARTARAERFSVLLVVLSIVLRRSKADGVAATKTKRQIGVDLADVSEHIVWQPRPRLRPVCQRESSDKRRRARARACVRRVEGRVLL